MMEPTWSWIRKRKIDVAVDSNYSNTFKDTEFLTRRLTRTGLLTGHNGCVNTVAWNTEGSLLLSGSDDCHLNVYDPFKKQLVASVHSSHNSNIFSAKFLPSSINDFKCVSCAGLGSVEYSEFTNSGDYLPHTFSCHTSITYQVACTPGDPNEFFTCEEKGLVRVYDLRSKSSCNCNGCVQDVLYSFPCGVTCMSIHPLQPFYVAMGLGDGTTCIMDRRMSRNPFSKVSTDQLTHQACSFRYKLDRSTSKPHKITSINFNDSGSELLVNFSEDYVYLFNSQFLGCGGSVPSNKKELKQFLTYKNARSKRPGKCDNSSSENATTNAIPLARNEESGPSIKRLRLRGDWSDTGPQARPEENIDEMHSIFMNRMSDIFTRWIGEALNDSTDDDQVLNSTDNSSSFSEEQSDDSTLDDSFESTSESCDSFVNSASVLTSAMASCSTSTCSSSKNSKTEHHDQGPCSHGSHSLPGTCDGSTCSTLDSEPDVLSKHNDASESEPIDIAMKRDLHSTIDESVTLTNPLDQCPIVVGSHSSLDTLDTLDSISSNTKLPLSLPPSPSYDEQLQNLPTDESCSEDEHSHVSTAQVDDDYVFNYDSSPNSSTYMMSPETSSPCPSWLARLSFPTSSDEAVDHEETCSENIHTRQHSNHDHCVEVNEHLMQYRGHRNVRTMIKQANFWGDQYVMSGSDCGRVFVWDKWSGEIVNLLDGDSHVVNCVQPHPSACMLATSGIENDIKLWEPTASNACQLHDLDDIVQRNEIMLQESRGTLTIPSSFIMQMLAYLGRRRRAREENSSDDEDSESN